jgi:hypothetical protein
VRYEVLVQRSILGSADHFLVKPEQDMRHVRKFRGMIITLESGAEPVKSREIAGLRGQAMLLERRLGSLRTRREWSELLQLTGDIKVHRIRVRFLGTRKASHHAPRPVVRDSVIWLGKQLAIAQSLQ